MAQPYVGEIRLFAGNFAPAGWMFCSGQLLPISENETLFNLIGTTYGGDGQSTFALPDLQSRAPMHMGQGPGLSGRILAERGGVEAVTLTSNQMPQHGHQVNLASNAPANSRSPIGGVPGQLSGPSLYGDGALDATLPMSLGTTGGSQPHDNMQPYLVLNFIISLFGIFPSQT